MASALWVSSQPAGCTDAGGRILEFLRRLLSPEFMPHGYCYLWDPWIVWLNVISDSLITLAYFCIPLALVYLVRQRRDLPFNWIFWMFALFILGCGTTHLMEVWTVWHGSYLLSGIIKALTAIVSVVTAVMLVPLIPQAIALPSPERLRATNQELMIQIAERRRGELALQDSLATSQLALHELANQKSAVAELRNTEEALRESQNRLGGIIDSAMDAIITLDDEQRIVLFNLAAEQMFCCSAAAVLGQSMERFIPQRFRTHHGEHIRRFAATGVTSRAMGTLGALWGLRADGEEFPLEASISQIELMGKKLFTVILRDISERKRIEAQLHVSEERFRLLLDGVKDFAIYMVDPDGRVLSWNAGATRMKGYSSEEILGQHFSRFYTPEDQAKGKPSEELRAAITHGRFEEQGLRTRKDGSVFWASVVITPMYDDKGTLRGFSKIARDITERRRAEEALRTQTLMLQSVLDSMGEGLVAADEQGKFLIWNRAAENIVGYGAADLPVADWSAHYGVYLSDQVTPCPSDQLPLVRALRGESSEVELFMRNAKLPEGAWIEATAHPLKDENGEPCGGVVAFRDVSRKRADEREIRRLNNELEQRVIQRTAELEAANRELEAFSYSVSHDLRAPLRHIAGFSGILLEEFGPTLDPRAQRHLQRIQEGTQRMGVLVDELLNLSRVGRHALNLQTTALKSLVDDIVPVLQSECEGREVEWNIGELPRVNCDSALIRQVFQNLLSNALKYSRPRSRAVIEVGQSQIEGQPAIFVRDNGVGFNMKYADKLFGVFQRLHRADEFEGTGIGLATVQRIIHKHGGRIWADAELDRGATFYFTLNDMEKNKLQDTQVMVRATV